MDSPTPAYGSIVHVEIHTPETDPARSFYEEAFDWSFQQDAGEADGATFQAPSPPHGEVRARPRADLDLPATLAYLHVEDLQATLLAVDRAGGKALGPRQDVPGMGALAVFQAPGGIVHGLWERDPDTAPPQAPPQPPRLGSIIHLELHSENAPATRRFYEDLFGWQFEALPEMDTAYDIATLPSPPDGGLMQRQEGPFQPPATLAYLLVDDVNEALSRVYHAGGRVLGERYEIEEFGAFGVFEAPGGVVQAVWENP